jgi:hypothetical protein
MRGVSSSQSTKWYWRFNSTYNLVNETSFSYYNYHDCSNPEQILNRPSGDGGIPLFNIGGNLVSIWHEKESSTWSMKIIDDSHCLCPILPEMCPTTTTTTTTTTIPTTCYVLSCSGISAKSSFIWLQLCHFVNWWFCHPFIIALTFIILISMGIFVKFKDDIDLIRGES